MAKLNLFKKKPVTEEDLKGIKEFLSNKKLKEGYYPLNTVGFGAKKYAGYVVYINSDGSALDIIQEGEMPSHQVEIENIKQKELEDKERKKTLAKRAAELGIEREENEKLLKELRSDSEKIDGRFNDAQKKYLTARVELEELTAGHFDAVNYSDIDTEDIDYKDDLRALQNTAEYKLLAQKEIDALKRFFKVSNALSGLSEELAASDQDYQAIDYNKKVQDIVTEPASLLRRIAGKPRRIPEGDPGSIDRNRIRDYKSQADVEIELARKHAGVATGVFEGAKEGESSKDYSKRMLETVSAPEPEKTPYDTFSTDELLELLIKENKKKTGK